MEEIIQARFEEFTEEYNKIKVRADYSNVQLQAKLAEKKMLEASRGDIDTELETALYQGNDHSEDLPLYDEILEKRLEEQIRFNKLVKIDPEYASQIGGLVVDQYANTSDYFSSVEQSENEGLIAEAEGEQLATGESAEFTEAEGERAGEAVQNASGSSATPTALSFESSNAAEGAEEGSNATEENAISSQGSEAPKRIIFESTEEVQKTR